MAITEHMRSVAHTMFKEGETTQKVARRIRQSRESTAALKANWTRSQPQKKTSSKG